MTRAARAWAALSDADKEAIFNALHTAVGEPAAAFVRALAADATLYTALHGRAYQHWLIPEQDAGPRLTPEACDDCGSDVTRPRLPWLDPERGRLWLGEGCYRDRLLHKRRGDDLPGDQLQAFATPEPIQED